MARRDIRTDTTTDGRPRDGKRAPRGAKSKQATLARKTARSTKRTVQGRA